MNPVLATLRDELTSRFQGEKAVMQRPDLLKVHLPEDTVRSTLSYLKGVQGFRHFVMMSCVDRIEDNQFELVWILWHPEHRVHVMLLTRIDRDRAEFETCTDLWRQVETYEREIWEMYGITFIGHPRLEPFILEDWENTPPMRRDFDTLHYVNDHYLWRDGREENHQPRGWIGEQFDEWRKK